MKKTKNYPPPGLLHIMTQYPLYLPTLKKEVKVVDKKSGGRYRI